jgi:serine/threonine protein kinase
MKKIGEGAAGEVFVATDSRDGQQVAIKKMALRADNMKLLVTEIGIMKDSQHENITGYFDSFIVDNNLWVRFSCAVLWSLDVTLDANQSIHQQL